MSNEEKYWLELRSILEPLDWRGVFENENPVVLDLGAGAGAFALAYAEQRRDWNILAVERLLGRVRKIARNAERRGLINVRVLRLESAYTVEYLVPPDSVQEVHLLFPDPWPKRKHHAHRVVQPRFLAAVARTLKPGGLFRFATDHFDYFRAAVPLMESCGAWQPKLTPEIYPMTDFERGFRAGGLPIHEKVWQKFQPA